MRQGQIEANGICFAYLEAGSGPLVLLLHGYPDNAWSWEHQLPVLADAGYRAVAPFLRGYPPTDIPANGYYDMATLAADVAALVDALGDGAPALLIGQDWGAAISYGVLAAFPEKFRRAAILAIPHPDEIRRTLRRSPRHAIRSFHWFLFQLPWLPEWLSRTRDFAFIEYLWRLWSPGYVDETHIERIKNMLTEPGAVEAGLAYYRALLRRKKQDPALADVRKRLTDPIRIPTLVLCGDHDMRREMLERQRRFFAAGYEWDVIAGTGHFLHRERPDTVNTRILDWLAR